MSAIPVHQPSVSSPWQAGFLALLPAVQTHAHICFRKLPAEQREEAVQEAIASACVSYQLLAARGKLHAARPGTLADFAVKHVNSGRHVGGKQDAAKDVISPVAWQRHAVRVQSYYLPGAGAEGWKSMVIADRKASIPDLAAFRIDFAQWLATLSKRDRRIIAALADGERAKAVAQRFGLSAGRVSQMRRRYERRWMAFQGEAPDTVAA